jgi:hypothetical protein
MIDIVRELVAAVKADTTLNTGVGGRVYGNRIPQGAAIPLILVTAAQNTPATRPQTTWWRSLTSIDVHAEDPAVSLALATRVQEITPTIVGARATCVITACQVESRLPVVDDGWTPTRFRQVVTVDLTAREL